MSTQRYHWLVETNFLSHTQSEGGPFKAVTYCKVLGVRNFRGWKLNVHAKLKHFDMDSLVETLRQKNECVSPTFCSPIWISITHARALKVQPIPGVAVAKSTIFHLSRTFDFFLNWLRFSGALLTPLVLPTWIPRGSPPRHPLSVVHALNLWSGHKIADSAQLCDA